MSSNQPQETAIDATNSDMLVSSINLYRSLKRISKTEFTSWITQCFQNDKLYGLLRKNFMDLLLSQSFQRQTQEKQTVWQEMHKYIPKKITKPNQQQKQKQDNDKNDDNLVDNIILNTPSDVLNYICTFLEFDDLADLQRSCWKLCQIVRKPQSYYFFDAPITSSQLVHLNSQYYLFKSLKHINLDKDILSISKWIWRDLDYLDISTKQLLLLQQTTSQHNKINVKTLKLYDDYAENDTHNAYSIINQVLNVAQITKIIFGGWKNATSLTSILSRNQWTSLHTFELYSNLQLNDITEKTYTLPSLKTIVINTVCRQLNMKPEVSLQSKLVNKLICNGQKKTVILHENPEYNMSLFKQLSQTAIKNIEKIDIALKEFVDPQFFSDIIYITKGLSHKYNQLSISLTQQSEKYRICDFGNLNWNSIISRLLDISSLIHLNINDERMKEATFGDDNDLINCSKIHNITSKSISITIKHDYWYRLMYDSSLSAKTNLGLNTSSIWPSKQFINSTIRKFNFSFYIVFEEKVQPLKEIKHAILSKYAQCSECTVLLTDYDYGNCYGKKLYICDISIQ